MYSGPKEGLKNYAYRSPAPKACTRESPGCRISAGRDLTAFHSSLDLTGFLEGLGFRVWATRKDCASFGSRVLEEPL